MGATYGPVTILCALVDLQVKQSVVTKRHGMQRLRNLRGCGGMGTRGARWLQKPWGPRGPEGEGVGLPSPCIEMGFHGKISSLWMNKTRSKSLSSRKNYYWKWNFRSTLLIWFQKFFQISSPFNYSFHELHWIFPKGFELSIKFCPACLLFGKTTARLTFKKSLSFWNNLGTD